MVTTTKPASKTVRKASELERRVFVFEVYNILSKLRPNRISYTTIHNAVNKIQPVLKAEHSVDLGYRFDTYSLIGPWDKQLQEDLEILDARGVVDNHDDDKEVITKHELSPTFMGRRTAELRAARLGSEYLFGQPRSALTAILESSLSSTDA
jgi:hypothetical protein